MNKSNKTIESFKGHVWKQGRFTYSEFYIKDDKIGRGIKSRPYDAAYIIPPFTDPHIHGGWGYDFEKDEFGPLEDKLKQLGVFCAIPTISCSSLEKLKKISAWFEKYKSKTSQSIFPFLRVEGPFINPEKKGIQDNKNILFPSIKNLEEWLSIDHFKMFTFAPEIKKSDVFVEKSLYEQKIPSVGHSQATFKEFSRLYRLGLRHMTHYPNAMSTLHHREIGLTGAGLLLDDLQLEVIADGIHTSLDFFQLLLKIKGPTFCITSDMVPAAHSKQRKFPNIRIDKTGRQITTKDQILAGGATSVPEQAKILFELGIKPEKIVPLACLNSLKFFNLPLPKIKPGEDADFVVLNQSFEVEAVYEKGHIISGVENWKTD
ncbi:MAG: amidohydrolase family protein [Acidobacteriota bacterium]